MERLLQNIEQLKENSETLFGHPFHEIQRIMQRDCMSPELTDTELEDLGGPKRLVTAPVPWRSEEVSKSKLIIVITYIIH